MSFNLLSLDKVRLKLLDLSGRNRLLNFRHSPRRSLRVIDELPDEVFSSLLDGKNMQFKAVPEPTREQLIQTGFLNEDTLFKDDKISIVSAEQWAKHVGLNVDYVMPASVAVAGAKTKKHFDSFIQTLLYPRQLEAAVRAIKSDSDTSLEDAGVNILYLAFGFLEWEEERSKKIYTSPLLLLPVTIERVRPVGSGTYSYEISYSGDDVEVNLSLREKLKREYEIIIDEFDVEKDTPEDYFKKISKTIKKREKWVVKRNITLSLFNFSKLLMYLDLDPKNWNKNFFEEHTVLSKLFSENYESPKGSIDQFATEYDIDKVEKLHKDYPLVLDADSSQHSALIDALKGKDLVIEGPPGTGKSQTISNLIAAALGQGKKVLFVAEKMAALEVVKRNLDKVGLGDFCLELHSDKTSKQYMLDSIRQRMSRKFPFNDIEVLEVEYEDTKQSLSDSAEKLNNRFHGTNYTAHDIFMEAVKYRKFYNPVNISFELPLNFDQLQIDQIKKSLKNYHDHFLGILYQFSDGENIATHPWFGIHNANLPLGELPVIIDQLTKLLSVSEEVTSLLKDISNDFNVPFSGEYEEAVNLTESFLALPDLSMDEWKFYHELKEIPEKSLVEIAVQHKFISELLPQLKKFYVKDTPEFIGQTPTIHKLWSTLVTNENSTLYNFDNLRLLSQKLASVEKFSIAQADVFNELGVLLSVGLPITLTNLKIMKLVLSSSVLPNQVFSIKENKLFVKDSVFTELREEIDHLLDERKKLDISYVLNDNEDLERIVSLREILRNNSFLRWMDDEWRVAKTFGSRFLRSKNKISGPALGDKLDDIIAYFRSKEKFEKQEKYINAIGGLFKGLDTDIQSIEKIRNWHDELCQLEQFGIEGGIIKNTILGMSSDEFARTASILQKTNEQLINNSIGDIKIINELTDETQLFQSSAETIFSAESEQFLEAKERVDFLVQIISSEYNFKSNRDCFEAYIDLDKISDSYLKFKGLISKYGNASNIVDPTMPNRSSQTLQKVLDFIVALNESDTLLVEVINKRGDTEYCNGLKESLKILRINNELFKSVKNEFSKLVLLNDMEWLGTDLVEYGYVIEKIKKSLYNPDSIYNWVDYLRSRDQLHEMKLDWFYTHIESCDFGVASLESIFSCALFDRLAKSVLRDYPLLNSFNGHTQERVQQEFRALDEKLKISQQKIIAFYSSQHAIPAGVRGKFVGDYTEKVLLDLELGKQKRHQPIRKILDKAGGAISALKPCFMMSPMSVSRYLRRGQLFDLIIMDEASQIRPEDAIGAIARGAQIVVVGDSKQLPPTNFFASDQSSDDIEDTSAVEDGESILEVVGPFFQPSRRLRWHYRSRHESLITFSNNAFYDGDLIVFPSSSSVSDEFGIKFHKINGTFLKGRNSIEARIVAKAIAKHLQVRKEESVGVVAMNKEQADLIKDEFELLLASSGDLRDAYDENKKRHGAEALFIKNLENVQGDERDVILISFTYGPLQPRLPVPQRFGPVNRADGWRRLNVLYTRSKKRMHIFTSMLSGDILIHPGSSRGLLALKNFLAFAETKEANWAHTDASFGGVDSPFESEVVAALLDRNYLVETQVGVAGYKIDIAVRDSLKPGNFLLGIECDGATYHSAKSARDRDILRQKVLEGLNWKIHRIWSTDWFKNPALEIKRMGEKLAILQQEAKDLHEKQVVYNIDLDDKDLDHVDEDLFRATGLSLAQQLAWLQGEHIDRKFPKTAARKKFLRSEMISALVQAEPQSRSEFIEKIPTYLVSETDSKQIENYLQDVVDIICRNIKTPILEE